MLRQRLKKTTNQKINNMSIETKFRAFQLDSPGSLFSYYKTNNYTLIEARLPKGGIEILRKDLNYHNKDRIDTLHVTSWDDDHCDWDSLTQIMNQFRPNRIEIPGYEPKSETGVACKELIMKYDIIHQKYINNVTIYNQNTIRSLSNGKAWSTNNIVYESLFDVDNSNDMSQIRLFRSSGFNVLSLGDCESKDIATNLMKYATFIKNETDIIILPHHGSENTMLTPEFLDFCKPILSVCSSNYDNEYSHPRQSVVNLLTNKNVKSLTTKMGDVVVIKEVNEDTNVYNYISNNNKLEGTYTFKTKRQLFQAKD
jgi:competence protein ComEC